MKESLFAKILPIFAAAVGVFLLTYWIVGTRQVAHVTRRNPSTGRVHAQSDAPQAPAAGTNTAATAGSTGTTGTATGATVPNQPGAWPRFRGANFDNIGTDATPLARTWPSGLQQYWSIDLGEGYAGAAVLNNRVYVLDYDQANRQDLLRCFAFATGEELWRRSYPANVKRNHGMSRTVPAVTEKYVVTLGPLCHLLCAGAVTGDVRWQHNLVTEYDATVPPWYAGQCPLIDGNRAVIAPGGKALMVAFDLATGKAQWQTPNPRGWKMTHSSIIPMTIEGQKMYVYCASDGVVGVSAETGALLWETTDWKVSTATIPVPVPIGDGRIFITGGYNAGSIMLNVGKQDGRFSAHTLYRVRANVFSSDQQSPILYKGYLYGVIQGGQLVCLDLNGQQRWASGPGHRFGLGPYLIADGMIYVLNDSGKLTLVEASPNGYKELAQAQILSAPDAWGPMALTGGRLIARNLTRMVCVDVARH